MGTLDQHCPDCGVSIDEAHDGGCDVARCLQTGRQRISCDDYPDGHDCGQDFWPGQWPDEHHIAAAAYEFGLAMGRNPE